MKLPGGVVSAKAGKQEIGQEGRGSFSLTGFSCALCARAEPVRNYPTSHSCAAVSSILTGAQGFCVRGRVLALFACGIRLSSFLVCPRRHGHVPASVGGHISLQRQDQGGEAPARSCVGSERAQQPRRGHRRAAIDAAAENCHFWELDLQIYSTMSILFSAIQRPARRACLRVCAEKRLRMELAHAWMNV
eukprot:5146312-Pleurochrysis_carterae.AAC.1